MAAHQNLTREPEVEKIWFLDSGEELIINIPQGAGTKSVNLTVIDGAVEIFGTKLEVDSRLEFGPGVKLSMLSVESGCTISFTAGHRFVNKRSDDSCETTMKKLRDVHLELENSRCQAASDGRRGPVVAVVGPTDSGKSSSCITLLNHAVQDKRSPLYVDLDLGQGRLSVPGTFGAVKVKDPLGFTGELGLISADITYFVGSLSPGDHVSVHNFIVSKFAYSLLTIMENDTEMKHSGMIINTCGWVDGAGYIILKHILDAFQVSHVIVLGVEPPSLIPRLKEDLPTTERPILVPKSELISIKTKKFRKYERERRVHEFFHKPKPEIPSEQERPYKFHVELDKVKIFKLSDSDHDLTSNSTKLATVPLSGSLVNHLFGVSKSLSDTREDILDLKGYVCLTKIDLAQSRLTLLAPSNQPPFQEAILLLSDVELTAASRHKHKK